MATACRGRGEILWRSAASIALTRRILVGRGPQRCASGLVTAAAHPIHTAASHTHNCVASVGTVGAAAHRWPHAHLASCRTTRGTRATQHAYCGVRWSSAWAAAPDSGGSQMRSDGRFKGVLLSAPRGQHATSFSSGGQASVGDGITAALPCNARRIAWHAAAKAARDAAVTGTSVGTRRAWLSTSSRAASASPLSEDVDAPPSDLDVVEIDGRDYLIDMATGSLYDIQRFVEDDLLVLVEGVAVPEDVYSSGVDAKTEVASALAHEESDGGEAQQGVHVDDDEFAPWNLENDTVGLGNLMTQYARPEVPRLTSLEDVKRCKLVEGHWLETEADGEVGAPPSAAHQWELHEVVTALLDEQADDVTVFELDKTMRDYADYVVIVSGRSRRHVVAMGERLVAETKRRKIDCRAGGSADKVGARGFEFWVVVAAQPCVVHIFLPEAREYYDLESLWGPSAGDDGEENDLI